MLLFWIRLRWDGGWFIRSVAQEHCISIHAALMKEVIHHIPQAEWESFFRLLSARMANGSSLIIITRPHEASYPLFPKVGSRKHGQKSVEASIYASTHRYIYMEGHGFLLK